jgi:ABC-type antimicrobial peptide transport system permease subunit
MKKLSAISAVILIALAVEVVSYFFLLLISFNQWEISLLGRFNHWLFISHTGQTALIAVFILASWPTQKNSRNIIRRTPNVQEEKNKTR